MHHERTPIVALGREAWSLNRRALLAGVAAAMLMAIAIGALVYSRDRFRAAREIRGTSSALLRSGYESLQAAVDAESAVESYLITRDAAELAELRDARTRIESGARTFAETVERLDGEQRLLGVELREASVAYVERVAPEQVAGLEAGAPREKIAAAIALGHEHVDRVRGLFERLAGADGQAGAAQAADLEDRATAADIVVLGALVAFFLVVALSVRTVTRRIVRPARRLARAMTLMAEGDHRVRVRPGGAPEVERMGRAFNDLGTALVAHAEQIEDHTRVLEARVAERTEDLEASRLELLRRLAQAAEYRDDDTYEHTERVGELAAALGRGLGLPEDDVERLRLAAPLHDVGKIGVSDSVLRKPGMLDPEERIAMQWHTQMGARLLAGSASPVLQLGEEIALSHHEHWDGNGYPFGLCGEEIPRCGRIVAVADVFDALTHDRPYKAAWLRATAIEYVVAKRGTQFDPAVVDAFCVLVGTAPREPHGLAISGGGGR
jgi:HAMP domain-containing protein